MHFKVWSSVFITGLSVLLLFYIFILKEPSNNRNWDTGFKELSGVNISESIVMIDRMRNWKYDSKGVTSYEYLSKKYNSKDLIGVWFVVEPFSKWDAVAHTYFIFDFRNGESVAVSIEARREKGEEFNMFTGLFNNYELIYVWGTEADITGRRVLIEDADIYMYPLSISQNAVESLFLQMAHSTREIEAHPKFYNTLADNCTNILAKDANEIKPGTVPFNISWFLPGLSDEYLYSLGYIDNTEELETLKVRYKVSDLVRKYYGDGDFSLKLRNGINERMYQE